MSEQRSLNSEGDSQRRDKPQYMALSNSFIFMVPLWPKYSTFCCGDYKAKLGLWVPPEQQPGLFTMWTSVHDGKSFKMQDKQDYSSATLHMVSLLQENTVQRLLRIECNTTLSK